MPVLVGVSGVSLTMSALDRELDSIHVTLAEQQREIHRLQELVSALILVTNRLDHPRPGRHVIP